MKIDLTIFASELISVGVDPNQWKSLAPNTKKAIASDILHRRGSPGAEQAAFLIETNNPNAMQQLNLVWDV